MARQEANWVELKVETLSEDMAQGYAKYKDIYRQMKEARQAFEDGMNKSAELPEGKRLVFGYNFGKLSVAIVDDDRKPTKAQAPKQTLAQFLAAQAGQGRGH